MSVNANPDDIEAFAQRLQTFSDLVREQTQALGAGLRNLGSSGWQDQRYHQFESDFEPLERQLLAAAEELSSARVPELQRAAAKLRDYLQGS